MKKTYGELLKPAKIGKMEIRNRVAMAPTDYDFVYGNYQDATFTKRLADVYKERAKGGCGLIFTGGVKIEQKLDPFPKSLNYPVMDRHESVKKYCGDDYPIILNLCIDEKLANIQAAVQTTGEAIDADSLPKFSSNGITTEYAIAVAQEMERRGLVDAYEVRIGNYYNQEHIVPSAYSNNDEYMAAIRQSKKGVTMPVIFENKLNYPVSCMRMVLDFSNLQLRYSAIMQAER